MLSKQNYQSRPYFLLPRPMFALLVLFLLLLGAMIQSNTIAAEQPIRVQRLDRPIWRPLNTRENSKNDTRDGYVAEFDTRLLTQILDNAPLHRAAQTGKQQQVVLPLPMPDGSLGRFSLFDAPMMEPALAKRHPELRTFAGYGLDDPTATVRLDLTPVGFHALILSGSETVFIDPYSPKNRQSVISYFAPTTQPRTKGDIVIDDAGRRAQAPDWSRQESPPNGTHLRTYRLAAAATGRFTQTAGSASLALAQITTLVNRINAIYTRELAIEFVMVDDNHRIIYTDPATDPYNDEVSLNIMIFENQTALDGVIGSQNYDIGHVFDSINGGYGGIGRLGSVCTPNKKAGGATNIQLTDPVLDMLTFAHEIGHQFGADHTFNGSDGYCRADRYNNTTAFEPGSGSTIMSYAGDCETHNIVSTKNEYFHRASLDQIIRYITLEDGNSCPTLIPLDNAVPVVDAGDDYTIPADTPFTLNGTASDEDGDPVLYTWEEFDIGAQGSPNNPYSPPYFRSYVPTDDSERIIPLFSERINGFDLIGEALPRRTDTINFRLTARDGRGGSNADAMQINVVKSNLIGEKFGVTVPQGGEIWHVGEAVDIEWNVGNTTSEPINCANVTITLSKNGGHTYPLTIISSTPNDGYFQYVVPNRSSSNARVKVACTDNIFFAVSQEDIMISSETLIGGPYTTTEGEPIQIAAAGSSNPNDYKWDWDGDGQYDDATGNRPVFDLVGQDGVYEVKVRIERNGTAIFLSTSVTVTNVEPILTTHFTHQPVYEGEPWFVLGAIVKDSGWEDEIDVTAEWGDGTAVEGIIGISENNRPDATMRFDLEHVYGSSGQYPLTICMNDDDTENCQLIMITVLNQPSIITEFALSQTNIEEGKTVSLSGTVTDPGWLSRLSATIDWGFGPVQTNIGTLENIYPDATLTFDKTHRYGDNGTFPITFCVTDGRTQQCVSTDSPVVVSNRAPTVVINQDAVTLVNGDPVIFGRINQPTSFSSDVIDLGSDDLLSVWKWRDGTPDTRTTYLVNPPALDPEPSPTFQPRAFTDTHTHTYTMPCLYNVRLSVQDDDADSAVDSLPTIITGSATSGHSTGYWRNQYENALQPDELECYLNIVNKISTVFSEQKPVTSISAAFDVLAYNGVSVRSQLDRELLTALLSVAQGGIGYEEMIDIDQDCVLDAPFKEVLDTAETVRANTQASDLELYEQVSIMDQIWQNGQCNLHTAK